MPELSLTKAAGGMLLPADPQTIEYLSTLKTGSMIRGGFKKKNNAAFHRKLMTLFQFAFDTWEPAEATFRGRIVAKNFDRFRKDITILAGFYDVVYDIRGSAKFIAKSLSFDSMDNDEREAVYNSLINVILKHILTQYKRDDLDNVVNQLMMGYA